MTQEAKHTAHWSDGDTIDRLAAEIDSLKAQNAELLAALEAVEQAQRDGEYASAFAAVRAALSRAAGK